MKKSKSRLLAAISLIFCVIITTSVVNAETTDLSDRKYTEHSIMNLDAPDNFESAGNPLGKSTDVPVLLLEQSELFKFVAYDYSKDKGSSTYTVYDGLKESNGEVHAGASIVNSGNFKTAHNGLYGLSCVKAVSFDPRGTSRRDHIAFIGVTNNKEVKLVVYDSVRNKWSNAVTVGSMSNFITNSTDLYELEEHLSITAGDYDNDEKETVVVFASTNSSDCSYLHEYRVNSENGQINIDKLASTSGFINPSYFDTYGVPAKNKRLSDLTDNNGKNMLYGELGTGDLDSDGIDDLVVMSYCNKVKSYKECKYPYSLFTPYVSVARGTKTSSTSILNQSYGSISTASYQREDKNCQCYDGIYGAGLAVGDFTGDGYDSIIVGGRAVTLKDKDGNGKLKNMDLGNDKYLNLSKITAGNGNELQQMFITGSAVGLQANKLTKKAVQTGKDASSSASLTAVAFNGIGNAEYLVIDGEIIAWDSATPELVKDFTNSGYWTDYGDVSFVHSVAAGDYDNNEYGYEQVVMTLAVKNAATQDDYDFHTIMIYGGSRDNSGIATDYSCSTSKNMDIDDRGDNYDEGSNAVVVAVDCDEDGKKVKYKDKTCVYSDPQVLAILQAAPYFSDLYDNDHFNMQNGGETTLSISEKHGLAYGEETTKDLEVGATFDIGGSKSPVNANIQAGYNHGWTDGWEKSVSYEIKEVFVASTTDQVVIYRTPLFCYAYDVFDPETGKYSDTMTYYVKQKPVYQQMSVSDYNQFANSFNVCMEADLAKYNAEKSAEEKIEFEKLPQFEGNILKNEGNPYKYQEAGIDLGSRYALGTAGGKTSSEITLCSESTSYTEQSEGFYASCDIKIGVPIFKAGVHGRFDMNWSSRNTQSSGTSLSACFSVGNIIKTSMTRQGYSNKTADSYGYNWQACLRRTGCKGKGLFIAGNNYDEIMIFGYRCTDVKSGVQVPVLNSCKYDTDSQGAFLKLDWEAGSSASSASTPAVKSYNVYLKNSDDHYELIATTTVSNREYKFRDFVEGKTEYEFAITAVSNDGVESIRSNEIIGYTDGKCIVVKATYKRLIEDSASKSVYYEYLIKLNNGTEESLRFISAGKNKGIDTSEDAFKKLRNSGYAGAANKGSGSNRYFTYDEWLSIIEKLCYMNGHLFTDEATYTWQPDSCSELTSHNCSICGQLYVDRKEMHAHEFTDTVHYGTCKEQGYTEHSCKNCGYSCRDTYTDYAHDYHKVSVAASCSTKGYDMYICANCGDYYIDPNSYTAVDKDAHEYKSTTTPATCLYEGESYDYCKYCGKVSNVKTIPKLETHEYVKYYTKVEGSVLYYENRCKFCGKLEKQGSEDMTCSYTIDSMKETSCEGGVHTIEVVQRSSSGRTSTTQLRFKIVEAPGYGNRTFTGVKGDTTPSNVFTYLMARYITDFLCEGNNAEHLQYTISNPMNEQVFVKCYLCSSTVEATEKHQHTYSLTNHVASFGADENYVVNLCPCHSCIITNDYDYDKHTHGIETVSFKANCTYKGHRLVLCPQCGYSYVESGSVVKTNTNNHRYHSKIIAPTCTEDGYTLNVCMDCGAESKTDVVKATGHTAAKGKDTVVEPTCTEKGYTTQVCSKCGETYIDEDSYTNALGHDYEHGETIHVAATCTHGGYSISNCSRCSEAPIYKNESDIDPYSHEFSADVHYMTCTSKGYTKYTCDGCGISTIVYFENEIGARITEKENTPIGHHTMCYEPEPQIINPTYSAYGYTLALCSECGEYYKTDFVNPISCKQLLEGEGAPSNDIGNNNDCYYETKNGDYYQKRNGEWTLIGNIKDDAGTSDVDGKIISEGISRTITFSDKVPEADKKRILECVEHVQISRSDEAVFAGNKEALLDRVFPNIEELTGREWTAIMSDPEYKLYIRIQTDVEVIDSDLDNENAPFIEYSLVPMLFVKITGPGIEDGITGSTRLFPEDFADVPFTVTLPTGGVFSPQTIEHLSDDGNELYEVFTSNGANTFVYDSEKKTVTFTINHFSHIRINGQVKGIDPGKSDSDEDEIKTGDDNRMMLYLVLGSLAMIEIMLLLFLRYRRKDEVYK